MPSLNNELSVRIASDDRKPMLGRLLVSNGPVSGGAGGGVGCGGGVGEPKHKPFSPQPRKSRDFWNNSVSADLAREVTSLPPAFEPCGAVEVGADCGDDVSSRSHPVVVCDGGATPSTVPPTQGAGSADVVRGTGIHHTWTVAKGMPRRLEEDDADNSGDLGASRGADRSLVGDSSGWPGIKV